MPVICEFCGDVLDSRGSKVVLFTCDDCKENIRQDNAIRDIVFHTCGDRLSRSRTKYDLYYCPFHSDNNPSFVVYDRSCRCYAGCLVHGREFGDVFDFVSEFYGITDFQETARMLSGKLSEVVVHRDYPEVEPRKLLTMGDIERLHRNVSDALEWFEERGVSRFTAYEKHLGMTRDWPNTYTFRTGPRKGEDVLIRTTRYSIPNIALGEPMYCKLRVDDRILEAQWDAIKDGLALEVREDMAAHKSAVTGKAVSPETISMKDVKRRLLGDRFTQLPGPKDSKATFNQDRFSRLTPKGIEYPHYEYALIHEGEIKAMVMEDCTGDPHYGYPSVSNKESADIARILQNVKRKIIIADNDDAGQIYANKNLQWLGDAEIIHPPDGLKAADDAVLENVVHEWMKGYGLEPVKLER